MGWRSRDVLRAAALVFGLYWLLRLVWFTSALLIAAFLGVLFGLAVSAGVDQLQRFRIRRGIGAALIVFGFIGLLVGFFAWSGPTLAEQSRELRTRLPEAFESIERWVDAHDDGMLGAVLGVTDDSAAVTAPDAIPGAVPASPPTAGAPNAAGLPADSMATTPPAASVLRDRIADAIANASRYLFPFLSSTFAVVAGIVLVIFLAIYVAAEPELYRQGLMHLFPHAARPRAGEVLSAVANTLRRWLVTQLVAMVVIATVTTTVLLLLDVPAALPLGLIAGLLEFVPNVGPILSAIPAIAMGFVDSPQKALYVALAYWAIQFLENQLLIPILMREGVDLPPALTIMAQALMALLFGFIGLLIAVPMLAAVMVAVKMLYVEDVVGDDVDVPYARGDDSDD